MKRRTILIIVAALVVAGTAAWFLLVKQPGKKPPGDQPVAPAKSTLSDDFYSATNIYLAGPGEAPSTIERVELTLIKAEAKRGDGKSFKIFDGSTKLVVQKGVGEKALNELLPSGPYGRLVLTFLPTASIIAADGKSQMAFLPTRTVEIDLHEDLPKSRTLAMLVRFDLDAKNFGLQGGVPTYILPVKPTVETYVLGGIYRNTRGVGSVWNVPTATLSALVKKDLGFDIGPKPSQTGTPAFNAPNVPPSLTAPR